MGYHKQNVFLQLTLEKMISFQITVDKNIGFGFSYTVLYHESEMIGAFQQLFYDKVLEFNIFLYTIYLKRTCV